MTRPSPKEIQAVADVNKIAVTSEIATRISNSIGPAFEGFAVISGTLPFDIEPATFLLAQTAQASQTSKVSK
jgi:hypothetical protein